MTFAARALAVSVILFLGSTAASRAAAGVPVIKNVIIGAFQNPLGSAGGCEQLLVTVTGENFGYGTVIANGIPLQIPYANSDTQTTGVIPDGLVAAPGTLSIVVENEATQARSVPYVYPASAPMVWVACTFPQPAVVFRNTSFSIFLQPTVVNAKGSGVVTLTSLPAGISGAKTAAFNAMGALVKLSAAANAPPGNYTISLSASWGLHSEFQTFVFTVASGAPPGFRFYAPASIEVGIRRGGTGQIEFDTWAADADYDITPSVLGLPKGTSATFSPAVTPAGWSVTVVLKAASDAELAQNVEVTLVGRPSASVPEKSIKFLLGTSAQVSKVRHC